MRAVTRARAFRLLRLYLRRSAASLPLGCTEVCQEVATSRDSHGERSYPRRCEIMNVSEPRCQARRSMASWFTSVTFSIVTAMRQCVFTRAGSAIYAAIQYDLPVVYVVQKRIYFAATDLCYLTISPARAVVGCHACERRGARGLACRDRSVLPAPHPSWRGRRGARDVWR